MGDACIGSEPHNLKECTGHLLPVRDALDVLSGKWKLPIIMALTFGNYRFKELHRQVGITPKMLSKELKEMEQHGLVKRTVYDTIPVTVEYELTPHGKTLKDVLRTLGEWGVMHRKHVMKPQTAPRLSHSDRPKRALL
ncbi:MAG: helix-turn-helix transcriptional regulator [Flavipsychrobacter sp.]|nr:helix-turn-helix transcriptional regulator [Flavipsychrobacter sp.]